MKFENVMKGRRSIRKFTTQELDIDYVKQLLKCTMYAPAASNRQHAQYIIVKDKEILNKLYKDAGAQKIILNAPVVIAVLYNKKFNQDHFANIQSVSACVQNLLLKAHEQGLGTCWIAGFGDENIAKNILKIPKDQGILCYILLGYPNENPTMPPKVDLNEYIHENIYSSKNKKLPCSVFSNESTLEQIKEHQRLLSRSSHLGADYEIYSKYEINKIKDFLQKFDFKNQRILNFVGYDGTLLKQLINLFQESEFYDLELDKEIIEFMKSKTTQPNYLILKDKLLKKESMDKILCFYSLEKLPYNQKLLNLLKDLLKSNGKLIIIYKNKYSLYGLMYYAMTFLTGKNNLSSFFVSSGPFEPISSFKLKKDLKQLGFKIQSKSLLLLPPELDSYYPKFNGYLKRHFSKLEFFAPIIKFKLSILRLIFIYTQYLKMPAISSVETIIATKNKSFFIKNIS